MNRKPRPTVKVTVRPQTDDESQRFDAAVGLLLADIVQMIRPQRDGRECEKERPTS